MKRKYRYMRKDFGNLPARIRHLTIYLSFFDDRVEATNCLEMTANADLKVLPLDASDLKVISVKSCSGPGDTGRELGYRYDRRNSKLLVRLERPVRKGEDFCIRTFTHCFPSDTMLEGIYRDVTPEGAPQQYMSQCEMWGFQRIMPVIDDPRAKCTMTTTIEADAGYTHMISNGNVSRETNPGGKPVPKPGDRKRKVITYENHVPISPYLFIAAVGTWDELVDSVKYGSGRTIRLEYLVPPGRAKDARIPMEILKKSVIWVKEKQDYEYMWDTYRTITMNKSDSGGMENTGNTTIIADAALVGEHTVDGYLIYSYQVIVHEFEHNQCGSETTMETPFDMWLNEAYTVDVERQFMAEQFNPTMLRLNHVSSLRDPILGPLAVEDAGYKGRVVREGFNDPDELIDSVTYDKAAEVIRMLRTITGGKFRKGKELYFSRYRGSNANTDQFFECFEEAWGKPLDRFKRGWLMRRGYPRVAARTFYDEKRKEYRITFRQKQGGEPFHIPVRLALVDSRGRDMPGTSTVFEFKEREATLVLRNIKERPAFASLNRDYSFYGTLEHDMTREELISQVLLDPNHFSRAEAMKRLNDTQRIRLMKGPGADVEQWWIDLYGKVLGERGIPNSLRSELLSIGEESLDRRYLTWYSEKVAAREKMVRAVSRAYRERLISEFRSLDTYSPCPVEKGIEDRSLKAVLLGLIAIEDSPESHEIIIGHYRKATAANDRVSALATLNRTTSPERREIFEDAYRKWHGHLSGYANYLRAVSSGTNGDVWEMMEREKNRDTMDLKNPTYARSLVMPMAFNTRMVWTDRGMRWVRDSVIFFSRINTTLAIRLLNTFQLVKRMKPERKRKVIQHLRAIAKRCRSNHAVAGQARAYLGSG
jgi:aminopeptidase N